MRQITINGEIVNDNSDCYVIAEIGHNHQGNLDKAKEMIRVAKECGADAVKFQKRDNRSLYTKALYNNPYEHENSFGTIYGEHREALEFGRSDYEKLLSYSKEVGITMFATAFDFNSADFLEKLDMPAFKIASGDLNNIPLLIYIAKYQKPMIVSTGGGTMFDVQRAYDAIMPINTQLCLLHCTSGYPADFKELNLKVISTYQQRFPDIVIGWSSHDNGIAMAVAGYMLGARVIEKHFTLNHTWKGTDHAFSLEPAGFRKMVRDIRRLRLSMGDGIKRRLPCEEKPLFKMSKKLVASRDLPTGWVLDRNDIAIKSPGDGLPPYELDNLMGRRLIHGLKQDENITFEVTE